MEQPIINKNNLNEQLIHPTQNYVGSFDNNAIPPCDEYYVDAFTDINQEANYLSSQITRTGYDTFILKRNGNTSKGDWFFIGSIIALIIFFILNNEKTLYIYNSGPRYYIFLFFWNLFNLFFI